MIFNSLSYFKYPQTNVNKNIIFTYVWWYFVMVSMSREQIQVKSTRLHQLASTAAAILKNGKPTL